MISPAFVPNLDQQTKDATWYHATTLKERMALLSDVRAAFSPLTEEQSKHGASRLKRWKNQTAFQDPHLFTERLATDSLTEADLLQLLAEPIEQVQERITASTGMPTWLKELLQALEKEELASGPANAQGPVTFVDIFKPLIEPERDRVLLGMKQLSGNTEMPPFEPEAMLALFQTSLAMRLHNISLRAVILEMHIARLQERLSGETPEERFSNFLMQLCQKEHLSAFLQDYPVLARLLVTIIHQWAEFSLELLHHLSEDWSEICAKLAGGSDPGVLVEVQGGVGDTHRNGRSVAILRFASGLQVVYKPRSVALDQHFQELLTWINEQQVVLPLRTLTILDHGNHGWIEFIEVYSCTTEDEVARFYERQGTYLALLYALDAVDFHYENILAAGEHPVLIDLEALFHPRFFDEEESLGSQSISGSVLRTTLLPQRAYLGEEGDGIDLSGIGGGRRQLTPYPVLAWEGNGTDGMRSVRERRELPEGHNRPKLQEQDKDVLPYEASFLHGFSEMYRLLIARRTELLTSILPGFAHDEIRVILRATRTYALLLTESFHPEYLRNALECERLFDHLWDNSANQAHLQRVIPIERRDFQQGDIPLFTTQPASKDVFSSQGERIPDLCTQSSMEYVRQRLQQMDENDLDRQLWIIQGSFATLITENKSDSRLTLTTPRATQVTEEQLVQAACAVGDRLKKLAFKQKQGINWPGIELAKESQEKTFWSLQAMSPLKLYDGIPGVVLFLSYLGELTGNTEYTDLARTALSTVQELVNVLLHPDESQAQSMNTCPIGAYDGLGSLIYLFSHLSALWHDPSYAQKAEELLDLLDSCIEQDKYLDIMKGSAGCIISLLSLYKIAPSAHTLKVAIHCGEYLLTHLPERLEARTMQPGFAYGLAGIAFSLLELSTACQDERFRLAALTALAYERSLFDPGLSDQKDSSVTWCHGIAGIGLARVGALTALDDLTTREEIALALQITRTHGFGLNHSLSHGDLGNLDVLLTANQILGDASGHAEIARRTAMLLESIERQGWCTGVPLGRETPGLMTGLAGTGYELLRLAQPKLVPSVLLLAPPNSQHQI